MNMQDTATKWVYGLGLNSGTVLVLIPFFFRIHSIAPYSRGLLLIGKGTV